MKKIISGVGKIVIEIVSLMLFSSIVWGTTYTVTSSYSYDNYMFAFSPATISITLGDTVVFSLASIHSALEVNQATWNANGNTSDGGFNTPFGGGTVIPTHTGTYYYVCANHYAMGMKGTITVAVPTGVRDEHQSIPHEFLLIQNYPNPFNPGTSITYELPVESRVAVTVIDMQGKIVATLVDQVQPAGFQSINWNAADFASGIYFYRMEATNISGVSKTYTQTKKMALVK